MTTSIPPATGGGSNAKYTVIGLVLLVGASVAIYMVLRPAPPPPAQPIAHSTPDAGPVVPIGPTVGVQISLTPEEPDSGTPDSEVAQTPQPTGGRHIRYIYHYVSACPGTVDGPRVTSVVRQNYGGLRECYNRELRTNPTLRGSVTAEWVINPNGTVGDVQTSGVVAHDHVFKSCFESSLSRLRFPPTHGGCANFQQSFSFTPGE